MPRATPEQQDRRDTGTRALSKRPLPFLGLFAAAFPAMLTGWLLHVYLRGMEWTWTVGRQRLIDVHMAGSEVAWTFMVILLTLAAVGLSIWAWHLADERKMPLRIALTGSVGMAVLDFGVQVGNGPGRWTALFGLVIWWIIAGMWTLPRLDVTRRDARTAEPAEDDLTKRLGLTGYLFKAKQYVLGGEVVRTDIDARHAKGGTIDPLAGALPAIESLADASGLGAPAGMSTVTQGAGASTSKVSVIHKDILAGGVPYEPPYALQRGVEMTIDEPEIVGRYIDLEPAEEEIRSTNGVIGTTGAGKTEYMRVRITGFSTRTWVAPILYFDQVKGMQSAAPVMGALGTCVLSNDKAPHKAGIAAVKRMIQYRADLLGRLGHDEWRPGIVDESGGPVPKVIAWFEESDTLIDGLERDMIFIAAKTRSTGIVPVWSQQRIDGDRMPTSLRANITSWTVFGITPGDDYTAGMALSDETVRQGAQPFWGDTKPGYNFRAERGIPGNRWPVVRRIFHAGREQYAAICDRHGPRMMPLDRGTIAATAGWYEQARAERDALAATMTAKGATVITQPAGDSAQVKAPPPITPPVTPPGDSRGDSRGDNEGDSDRAAITQEIEDDMREMVITGEVPANPDAGERPIDVDAPIAPVPPGDDVEWGEIGGKPAARDRPEALAALFRTLAVLSADESLRDPADEHLTVFQVDTVLKRYPFRSRPWFSAALAEISLGEIDIPAEYGLTLTVDDSDEGHYRLHRVGGSS